MRLVESLVGVCSVCALATLLHAHCVANMPVEPLQTFQIALLQVMLCRHRLLLLSGGI